MNNTPQFAPRTTIGRVYIEGRVKNASRLLLEVLSNAHTYDSADSLFGDLRAFGFSPEGLNVSGDTASACIDDPNLGKVRIYCQHIKVSVH